MKTIISLCLILIAFAVSAQNSNVSNGFVFDGEPYLAVNPQDNQHLVVAWMGFKFNERIVIKTRYSNDGGSSWSPVVSLPHQVTGNTSADVSLQFDHNGNVFVCYIDYDATNFSNGGIFVAKSVDGGASWNTPVEAININDCPNKLCVDRPWMEIDRSSGSNQGSIYVTSMNADENIAPPYNPYLVVSADEGVSFSDPRLLDTTGFLAGNLIPQPMPSPGIGADGTFYAVYPSYVFSQNLYATYIMASSQNKGESLSHRVIAVGGPGSGVQNNLAKKASLFLTDESDANHMAMIFLAEYNGDPDLFYMESHDKGMNWTSLQRVNQDAVSNGVMQDLVWADFNKNGDLAIAWRDRRNTGDSAYTVPTEIYAAVRFKGDTTFYESKLSDSIVGHDSVLEGSGNDFMCVELVGDTLYAVWGDVRTSRLNIWMSKFNIQNSTGVKSLVYESKLLEPIPNPAKDLVRFKGLQENERYILFNSLGKEVLNGVYNESIDVSGLKSGTYFVHFPNTTFSVSRLIIE